MDLSPNVDDSVSPSHQILRTTREIDEIVKTWSATGDLPFSSLVISPSINIQNMSADEQRLSYQVCRILNDVHASGTEKLTVWTETFPKFLGIAATYPFVMSAVYAFSAHCLSNETKSTEARILASSYADDAWKGLQEASSVPDTEHNTDAILSASAILSLIQVDWIHWATLMNTTKDTFNTAQFYNAGLSRNDFTRYNWDTSPVFTNETNFPMTPLVRQERLEALSRIELALNNLNALQDYREEDRKQLDQIVSYIHTLQKVALPQNPKDQFDMLYHFRKFVLWIPITLLCSEQHNILTLVIISYLYASSLFLEEVFPDICPTFLSHHTVAPLFQVLLKIQSCLDKDEHHQIHQQYANIVEYPKKALMYYQTRREWATNREQEVNSIHLYNQPGITIDVAEQPDDLYSYTPSLSPAFPSATIQLAIPDPLTQSSTCSGYLAVPSSSMNNYMFNSFANDANTYQDTALSSGSTPLVASPSFTGAIEADQRLSISGDNMQHFVHSRSGSGDFSTSEVALQLSNYTITTDVAEFGDFGARQLGGCVIPMATWI